jgi:hypothetical protein
MPLQMEARIALKYSGPAVDSGLMDVYEASANMVAVSDFFIVAAKTAFGDSTEARAEVAGFGRGSFLTDLVFNVAPTTATIFSTLSVKDLWEIIKGAIDLWKHLKGSPPKTIVNNSDSQTVNVTNNNGDIIQVRIDSLLVVTSEKGIKSVEKFVKNALEKPGMDSVSISSGENEIAKVNQAEAHYFTDVTPTHSLTDNTVKMALIIESPVFKDENKWRFSDGQNSFFADIGDKAFLDQVNSGERFGKGDVLIADVRINQEQSAQKITATRTVVKVHEHRFAHKQLSLHD